MNDFSLEIASERIQHPITKEYFKEVLSSYQIGNYRSAIVSLYSIVIADLINKLKDLVDREDDPGAKKILDEVNEERQRDTSLSKWETTLINKVYEQTKLIELHDKANIDSLKAHRNLSAHPAITDDDLLFTPNRETVRAHIRNMLEGVLNKPAMFTHQIVDLFISKFPALHEQWSDQFRDDDEIDEYDRIIHKRYLMHFTDKTIKKLFRTLYKLAYRTNNPEADEYRTATHDTVMILLKRYPDIVYSSVAEESGHYSNISYEKQIMKKISEFFQKAPRLFALLEEDTQKQVRDALSNKLIRFVHAWFLTGTPEEHYELVLERARAYGSPLSSTLLYSIKESAKSIGRIETYPEVVIYSFSQSRSYNESYDLFRQVRSSLKYFSEDQFNNLLSVMNTHSQINRLHNLAELVETVQAEAEEIIGHRIDLSSYKNL